MRIRNGLAVLTALATLLVPARTARAAGEIAAVPDVAGRSRAEASAMLAAEGFLVGIYEIAGDPPDTVAVQTPHAATALPRGGIVCIDVRRKVSDPTPAPKAVGLSTSAAVAAFGRLYDLHFEPTAGPASERGKVKTQAPAEGKPLSLRGAWTLRYVPDPTLAPTVSLPDVTGLTATQAIEALGVAGLHGQIVETAITGAPADLVIGELPLPGSEVPRESDVRIVVTIATEGDSAMPTGTPVVPNVVGLSESAAKEALNGAGFDTTVAYVVGPDSQAFLVTEQSPEAGIGAAAGTAVALTVVKNASPPPQTSGVSLPELVGLTAWQAEDLLVSIGLRANPVLMDNPSVPPLRVFAQQKAPGTVVASGSSVNYRVSRPTPPVVPVVVPNLFGKSVGTAVAVCAQAGVGLTIVEVETNGYPAWLVFSQSVAAYSQVPAGTLVVARVARPPKIGTTVVPDLTGKSGGEAAAMLAAASLSAHEIDLVAPGKPPFQVFDQQPPAGAQVAVGTLVQFKVAKLVFGWKQVPNVVGLTQGQAVAVLLAAGLQPDAHDVVAFGKPVGKAFTQSPAAGSLVQAGTAVSFQIAKAGVTVVPNVVGMSAGQAGAVLTAAGLASSWKSQFAPGKPPGQVFDQNPNAGALVANGSPVQFFVAGGGLPPAVALIPNLVGKTKAQAIATLASFGFGANADDVFAPGKPPGLVFAQSPVAGTGANLGTVVSFQVAKNPFVQIVAVPNLIGLTAAQANAALAAAQLGSNGKFELKLGKPLHKVYSQGAIPGSLVPKGTVISWKANP